jgi:heparin binding hemagglutinin HbhA
MPITDDLRKTITDPTPLYAVAGTADLAAEKLREVPGLIATLRAEAPERIAKAREGADPKAVQDKVSARAKEVQTRFNEYIASIDVKQFRDSAQDFALQQVGRAAEAAVKARETYDELAERGRTVVNNWRGETAEQVEDIAVAIEPTAAPSTAAGNGTGAKTAPKPAAKKAPARKPAAKRTTSAKPAG